LSKLGIISLLLLLTTAHANIPLPGRYIAQSKGLSGGVGLGSQGHSRCKTLFTWTGYGNYSYSSLLAAGASIKFAGGSLDSANSLIYQRYSINAMFNKIRPEYAMFLGPSFSFEHTDLRALISELTKIGSSERDDEERAETECREIYSDIGSSLGYRSGLGYLLTPDWGIALGHNLDLTFNGNYLISFGGSISFNLRNRFDKLIENTQNVWLSLEYSNTSTKKHLALHNIILGLALGF
jgi:hypothetical protein